MVENSNPYESSPIERAHSLVDLGCPADTCTSWIGHESETQRTGSLGATTTSSVTAQPMLGTSSSSSKLSTSQSCGLSRTGNVVRSAVLSRQPSFDFGGEGKLSSTQVKQRLKTHLLNRQRRANTADRFRRGDDTCPYSTTPSLDASGYGFIPGTNPTSELFTGKRGTYWHSADSANSIDRDPSDDISGSKFPTQHRSLDLSVAHDSADSHPVDHGTSVVDPMPPLSVTSYHHSPHPLGPAVLSAIEQLTAQAARKGIECTPTKEPCCEQTRFVEENRRTQSESDLLELSRLVHFLSQYLSRYPTEISTSHEVNSRPLTSHHPAFMPNRLPPMSHLLSQPTTSQYSPMNSRPTVLEPLLEPQHSTGSGHPLSADLPLHSKHDTDAKTPCMDLSTTFTALAKPRWSLGTISIGDLHTGCITDAPMNSPCVECVPSIARRNSTASAETSALPLLTSTVAPQNATLCSIGSVGETEMEWESDSCAGNFLPNRPSESLSDPHVGSRSGSLIAPRWSAFKHSILSFWSSLPTEDWTAEHTTSISSSTEFNYLPTALAFDPEMLGHACLCPSANNLSVHPENPERIRLILERLMDSFLQIPPSLSLGPTDLLRVLQAAVAIESPSLQQELNKLTNLDPVVLSLLISRIPLIGFCRLLRARMVTDDELCVFHSRNYVTAFSCLSQPSPASSTGPLLESTKSPALITGWTVHGLSQHLCKLSCGGLGVDSDTVWNPVTTAYAARLAVGQVLCLAHKVVRKEIRNGIALVRPPGHHAEPDQAMGFCYFNSVSIAALHMLRNPRVSRVLILDWDIHHGNGTKLATSLHPGLLYISIHRHDGGTFFPGTGSATEQLLSASGLSPLDKQSGNKSGRTQLINIAWGSSRSPSGDSDTHNSELNAVDRREIWRQYCFRRRQAARIDRNLSDAPQCSTETSSSSLCSPIGVADVDVCRCTCHATIGSRAVGSTGSSAQCSLCLSHSVRSSVSSIRSESVMYGFTPDFGIEHTTCPSGLTSDSSPANTLMQSPLLGLGDAEYLAAMRCVVIPIVHEFQPDVILISAGFDAASGHGEALGGYNVSPGWFAWATRQCLSLADSRVVLALEGGHIPTVNSDCFNACLNSLLLPRPLEQWVPYLGPPCVTGLKSPSSSCSPNAYLDVLRCASDWISHSELHRRPRTEAVTNLLSTIRFHANHGWRCMQDVCDENVALSFMEAIRVEQLRAAHSTATTPLHSAHVDYESKICHSPLTAGFAQLRMDHS